MTVITQVPTHQQIYRTFAAYCAAEYPNEDDMDGKVNVAALERLFAEDVTVDYLGYKSGKWNKLIGRASVIACLVEQATKEFIVIKRTQFVDINGMEVKTIFKTPEGKLTFEESYTMAIKDGKCVIVHVRANQFF